MDNRIEKSDLFEIRDTSRSLEADTEKSRELVGDRIGGLNLNEKCGVENVKLHLSAKCIEVNEGNTDKSKGRSSLSPTRFESVRKDVYTIDSANFKSEYSSLNKSGSKFVGSVAQTRRLQKKRKVPRLRDQCSLSEHSSALSDSTNDLDENSNSSIKSGDSPNTLKDKIVVIPKRPRSTNKQKKIENNCFANRAGDVTPIGTLVLLVSDNSNGNHDVSTDFKENSPFIDKPDHDVLLPVNHGVQRKAGHKPVKDNKCKSEDEISLKDTILVENSSKILEGPEDDEENLEQNAARMLSSRFDPTCTGLSVKGSSSPYYFGNGSLFTQLLESERKSSAVNASSSSNNHYDSESRVLRPRRQNNFRGFVPRRRRFYELCYQDIDAYWILNKKIKVFWPLDQSWYFGLVSNYDSSNNLHHVTYDDRDEEWINLQTERFKLLLFPDEVPHRIRSEGSASEEEHMTGSELDRIGDNKINGVIESEPIISWLSRTGCCSISSPLDLSIKQKRCKRPGHLMPNEEAVSSSIGRDSFSRDMSETVMRSLKPQWTIDGEIGRVSKYAQRSEQLPFVYFRKRFRSNNDQKSHVGDKIKSLSSLNFLPERSFVNNACSLLDMILPMKFENIFKVSLLIQLPSVVTILAESSWLYTVFLLLHYGTLILIWPEVQLEMFLVDSSVGLRFMLFEGDLRQAIAVMGLIFSSFCVPCVHEGIRNVQWPVLSIRFKLSWLYGRRKELIFLLYSYMSVKASKWIFVERKFGLTCKVLKELPLLQCSYENIKVLQSESGSHLPFSLSEECDPCEKKHGRDFQSRKIMDENCVNPDILSLSSMPTSFVSMHAKMLMEKNSIIADARNCLVASSPYILKRQNAATSKISPEDMRFLTHYSNGMPDNCNVRTGRLLLFSNQCHKGNEINGKSQDSISEDISSSDNSGTNSTLLNCAFTTSSSMQKPFDNTHDMSRCTVQRLNPTGPRSMWHRKRHKNSPVGDFSKLWHCDRDETGLSDFSNGCTSPRLQHSQFFQLRGNNFASRPRRNHSNGWSYRKMKNDDASHMLDGSIKERYSECLSCITNVLVTLDDRCWRECGADVTLECVNHKDWILSVRTSSGKRYSHKAHQFLQPGTVNRHTHAMMWKGGRGWVLEFCDRSQWIVFKRMHAECYDRNIRVACVKNIPIPGVYLIENDDEVFPDESIPFARNSQKYYRQLGSEIDVALDPSKILYDMESDDEEWLSNWNRSSNIDEEKVYEISDEMFERVMDALEKIAYVHQREDFTITDLENFMDDTCKMEIIKSVYEHWKKKREMRCKPLIRQFQPPLWEQYQNQLKEWADGISNTNNFANGSEEETLAAPKPQLFAFCLRPRSFEIPNKLSRQKSHRRFMASGHENALSRDHDNFHPGKKLNEGVLGEEKTYNLYQNQEFGPDASSWLQTTTKQLSRNLSSPGFLSRKEQGLERGWYSQVHRGKSMKMEHYSSVRDIQVTESFYESGTGKRTVLQGILGGPEWSSRRSKQPNGFRKYEADQFGCSNFDEFRLRDASSAAHHASTMAKLKWEKAQRLLHKADLALHRATVALITSEAIRASVQDEPVASFSTEKETCLVQDFDEHEVAL